MFKVNSSLDLLAELYEAGTLGIIEHDGWVEAFFDTHTAASQFGEPHEAPDIDWVQHTQDAWPPVLVGEKFFIVAPWRTEPTPAGRFRLEINPGLQCGTGQHPCTQKCLEAMERIVKPGDSVLDVGSGSGILSIAAKLLGAGRVVACDIDPEASVDFVGSVNAVRSNSFDVVVATINEEVIGAMLPDFERVAKHRILSGFQDEDGACIIEAYDHQFARSSMLKRGFGRFNGLPERGYSIEAVKDWREHEHAAGRPCGLDDFFRTHDFCLACRGTGERSSSGMASRISSKPARPAPAQV